MNSNFRRNFIEQTRVPQNVSSDNADNLRSYDIKPVKNDGDRGYAETRNQPRSTNAEYYAEHEINLRLASIGKDITCFDRSWIDMVVHETVQLPDNQVNAMRAAFPVLYDGARMRELGPEDSLYHEYLLEKLLAENQYIFIGYKMSSQAVQTYKFIVDEDTEITSSAQNQSIEEQFLYYVFKDAGEIANKKYVYSPYKEVDNFENSMCGTWIPLIELLKGTFEITFPLLMPYQSFLPLQSFDKYPTFLFGDFGIKIKTNYTAQVWTQVNPLASIKKAILDKTIDNHEKYPELTSILACPEETWGYHRAFQQIGLISDACFCTGMMVNGDGTSQLQFYTGQLQPLVTRYYVTSPVTYTHAYNIRTEVKDMLKREFLFDPKGGYKAFVVCGQHIDYYQLGNGTGSQQGTFQTTQQIPFRHTTDCYILYPMNSAQKTVFYNPVLEQHMTVIDGVQYPSQALRTDSPQFYMDQLFAADWIGSIFVAPDSYECSITNTRVCDKGYRKPTTDDTNFVEAVPLSNPYTSPTSDDTLNRSSEVRVYGIPYPHTYPLYAYTTDHPDPNMKVNGPPPPNICICQDIYFIFRRVINKETNAERASVQFVRQWTFADALNDYTIEGVVSK